MLHQVQTTRDEHWCVTVDYQQIANDNIANQIHGFTKDYGKFILILIIIFFSRYNFYQLLSFSIYRPKLANIFWLDNDV